MLTTNCVAFGENLNSFVGPRSFSGSFWHWSIEH